MNLWNRIWIKKYYDHTGAKSLSRNIVSLAEADVAWRAQKLTYEGALSSEWIKQVGDLHPVDCGSTQSWYWLVLINLFKSYGPGSTTHGKWKQNIHHIEE